MRELFGTTSDEEEPLTSTRNKVEQCTVHHHEPAHSEPEPLTPRIKLTELFGDISDLDDVDTTPKETNQMLTVATVTSKP